MNLLVRIPGTVFLQGLGSTPFRTPIFLEAREGQERCEDLPKILFFFFFFVGNQSHT